MMFVEDSFRSRTRRNFRMLVLGCATGLLALPMSLQATVNANLKWIPSSAPTVAGYNIYYGSFSGNYTNITPVGNVTSASISGLEAGKTYFFAATASDSAGNQSALSSEAIFSGASISPDGTAQINTYFANTNGTQAVFPNGDQITYSLPTNAPAGAWINPTNGFFSWNPGRAFASTTNNITVLVTDNSNPSLSTAENIQVVVSDYLDFHMGSTALQSAKTSSVPITVAASGTVTNIQINLAWPGNHLVNPTLTYVAPVVAGSIQNQTTNLLIQLQTAPGQFLTGTNVVALLNFQAAANQTSAFYPLAVASANANKSDSSSYAYVTAAAGEAVVVGTNPLLRAHADVNGKRSLTLYGNPGYTYQLQYATKMTSPMQWNALTSLPQTNVMQTVNIDSANPVVLYRLQQL